MVDRRRGRDGAGELAAAAGRTLATAGDIGRAAALAARVALAATISAALALGMQALWDPLG